MKTIFRTKKFSFLFPLIFLLLLVSFSLWKNLTLDHWRHFSLMAASFWQGRTDIASGPERLLDTRLGADGKYYLGLGPFTAVLMMPFVLWGGPRVSQGYLDFLILLAGIFMVNKIGSCPDFLKL